MHVTLFGFVIQHTFDLTWTCIGRGLIYLFVFVLYVCPTGYFGNGIKLFYVYGNLDLKYKAKEIDVFVKYLFVIDLLFLDDFMISVLFINEICFQHLYLVLIMGNKSVYALMYGFFYKCIDINKPIYDELYYIQLRSLI